MRPRKLTSYSALTLRLLRDANVFFPHVNRGPKRLPISDLVVPFAQWLRSRAPTIDALKKLEPSDLATKALCRLGLTADAARGVYKYLDQRAAAAAGKR